jgi:hypothetical protein
MRERLEEGAITAAATSLRLKSPKAQESVVSNSPAVDQSGDCSLASVVMNPGAFETMDAWSPHEARNDRVAGPNRIALARCRITP